MRDHGRPPLTQAEKALADAFDAYMGVMTSDTDERLFAENHERYVGLTAAEASLAFDLDKMTGVIAD